MTLALDIIVVSPAKLAVSGLDGIYARVTVDGHNREGQIYGATADRPWEAVAWAIASYYRRAILRERPNLARAADLPVYPPPMSALDFGDDVDADAPDPYAMPPRRNLEAMPTRSPADEVDPMVRAIDGLPLWGAR